MKWAKLVRPVVSLMLCTLVFALAPVAPAAAAPLGPWAEPSGAWSLWGDLGTAHLYGVALTPTSNGWIVGAGGVIYRWTGSTWAAETSPTTQDLNAVAAVPGSATQAYAVGGSATILHRQNSGVWQVIPPPAGVTKQLDSIYMVSATEGWIVGDGGTILHTTSAPTGWTVEGLNVTTAQLHAVAMFNNTDGFAVGGSTDASGVHTPVILRYSGGTWTEVASPRNQRFYHVHVRGPNEAWAVGTNRTIMRWTRATDSWEVLFENTGAMFGGTFYAISMPAADDGWVSGTGGELWHWNGESWTAKVLTGDHLYFAQLPNTSEGWAVGRNGFVWRYQPLVAPLVPYFLPLIMQQATF